MTQVWPVIHLSTLDLALSNAAIAHACGCPGVFVISMDGKDDAVDPVARQIQTTYPQLKVGVNYLTLPADVALARSLAQGFAATWTDSPGVNSQNTNDVAVKVSALLARNPEHLFFGSVAFKYQAPEADPAAAAVAAHKLGMIATTSGDATGVAPSVAKLASMRKALGDAPLAVASGITPDNAFELCWHVSHVLVATGVSRSFYSLDEDLLRALVRQLED